MALLDELSEIEISPDADVEWVVCDGDLAIEGAVEKRCPGQRNAEHRSHLMGMIRGVFTTTSEMEAHARFRALAQEDASLARYLFPPDPVRKDRCSWKILNQCEAISFSSCIASLLTSVV